MTAVLCSGSGSLCLDCTVGILINNWRALVIKEVGIHSLGCKSLVTPTSLGVGIPEEKSKSFE